MRRVLMMALVGSAFAAAPMAPAQAALTLIGTFNGNQCNGGDITTCFANGTMPGTGTLTQVGHGDPVPGSPGILRGETSGGDLTFNIVSNVLSFNYSGSEVATYIGLFQGGSGLNNTCDHGCNTYQLFYDAGGITTGTINLSTYFNNPGLSHIDLFDNGATTRGGDQRRGGMDHPCKIGRASCRERV